MWRHSRRKNPGEFWVPEFLVTLNFVLTKGHAYNCIHGVCRCGKDYILLLSIQIYVVEFKKHWSMSFEMPS